MKSASLDQEYQGSQTFILFLHGCSLFDREVVLEIAFPR